MRKALIGLVIGLLAMSTIGIAAAQDGSIRHPVLLGYGVDVAPTLPWSRAWIVTSFKVPMPVVIGFLRDPAPS